MDELATLVNSLSIIYDKMELSVEGHNPFEVYRLRRYPLEPKEKLEVKRIRYGSDLVITAACAGIASAFVSVISLILLFRHEREEQRRRRLKRDLIKNYLLQHPEIHRQIQNFAKDSKMETERVIDYIEPEVIRLLNQRPRLIHALVSRQKDPNELEKE